MPSDQIRCDHRRGQEQRRRAEQHREQWRASSWKIRGKLNTSLRNYYLPSSAEWRGLSIRPRRSPRLKPLSLSKGEWRGGSAASVEESTVFYRFPNLLRTLLFALC